MRFFGWILISKARQGTGYINILTATERMRRQRTQAA